MHDYRSYKITGSTAQVGDMCMKEGVGYLDVEATFVR